VGRRRLLAGLGGASLTGVAASVYQAAPAAAAVSWTSFSPALKLREVQATGVPAISGVTTTAQWAEDTNSGLVYIQFQCAFTSAYTTPTSNGFWGFDDLTLHGLPAPKLPPTGVNNVMGGSVTAYPAGLAAFAPGGHQLLVAGFSGHQVLFAHGSTAAGVTTCYLNRNSPYTWTYAPADPTSLAIIKGTVFYRKA
jgi:hypothetical protein